MPSILVATDTNGGLEIVEVVAADLELGLQAADDVDSLFKAVHSDSVELVLLDAAFGDTSGMLLYQQIAEVDQHLPVVIVASRANSREAIEATRLGALDYLVRPLDEADLRRAISNALEIRRFASEPITLNPESPMEEDGDAGAGESEVGSVGMDGSSICRKLNGLDGSSMTVLVMLSAKRTDWGVAGATGVGS